MGVDIAYALDCRWTIAAQLEAHFLDHCHRKRHSFTGIDFVDDYHKTGKAYGFNGTVYTTFLIGNCYHAILSVDIKYWKADAHHDTLEWNSAGAHLTLGYSF